MKKFKILAIILSLLMGQVIAQSPQKFNYQAVARDGSGNILANQNVSFRISIVQGSESGTAVYVETHAKTTNGFGQVTLAIGGGTPVSGTFGTINWGSSSYYIKTEMDAAGGNTYAAMGTSQLLSVPYALHSNTAAGGGDTYTAGSGIAVNGTIISNTAPDQTVAITSGTGISATGTYPNFTVTNTQPNATHTGDATGGSTLTVVKLQGRDIATTAPANGQALKWNTTTSKWEPATDNNTTYTSGDGISIAGTTISNSAPDQTVNITTGGGIISGGTYPNFTIFNTQPNATHTGDATGSGALTVERIQGQAVSAVVPVTNQVLQWNGTQWSPSTLATPAAGWSLTGNSGTSPATNFIGTTDNVPFVVKVNNQMAGTINPISNNAAWGFQAYNNNSTGGAQFNSAFGSNALYSNTSGYGNTAIGSNALLTNQGNSRNTAIGYNSMFNADNRTIGLETRNTAVGCEALKGSDTPANNTGWVNTAVGDQALYSNTSGYSNSALGVQALHDNTTGYKNTAYGSASLFFNVTGNENTAYGHYALQYNVAGSKATAIGKSAMYYSNSSTVDFDNYNVAVGYEALKGSTTASANTGNTNTAIGYQTLYSTSSGGGNTATGSQALFANTTGYDNTANGLEALKNNETGQNNAAMGVQALLFNSTGSDNTAVGATALQRNTTGNNNTAHGSHALYHNKANSRSTAIGMNAMKYADDQSIGRETFNTAVGFEALRGSTTQANNFGRWNTAVGDWAMYLITSGDFNTVIGKDAGASVSSGSSNVLLGYQAGFNITTGSNNIIIGSGIVAPSATSSNQLVIGSSLLLYGDMSTNRIGLGVTGPTEKLDIDGQIRLRGGSPAAGKILTSAADGTASWQTLSVPNYWSTYGNNIYNNNSGNVGIGVSLPSAKLEVSADVLINGMTVGHGGGDVVSNSVLGFQALYTNTTGSQNTALGRLVLHSNTTGQNNTSVGYQSMFFNIANNRTTAIGSQAMYNADNRTIGRDTYNTAVGYRALYGSSTAGNNTGQYNTAIGDQALYAITSGSNNTGIGYEALNNSNTGSGNVAVGYFALGENVVSGNVVSNTAVGSYAGGKITTGYGNTLMGEETGRNISTGYDNVWIGKKIGNSGTITYNNTIILGANTAVPTASNRTHIGNTSMSWIGGQVTWSTYSDRRFKNNIKSDIPGLDFILKLNPVSYQWDVDALNAKLGVENDEKSPNYKDVENIRTTGFLAQEVEEAANACGYEFSGVDKTGDMYSLSYSQFVVPMVKAMQEQQQIIEQLSRQNTELLKRIEKLESQNK